MASWAERSALFKLSIAQGALACLLTVACDEHAQPGETLGGGSSEARVHEPTITPLTEEQLLDPKTCQGCHPQHYEEWAASMHAYASDDPVFLAMNRLGQRETEGALGDFCVQCHAPLAHRLGATTDGLNLSELPDHLRGVTCAFCHQVESVQGTHNNPLEWRSDGVMRGAIREPASGSPHRSRYSPLMDRKELASSSLCGACHDVVTPRGVHLERTYQEWSEGLFNSDDPRARNTCNDCHMPSERAPVSASPNAPERRRSSHLSPGVDVHLTLHPGRARMLEAVRAELRNSLLPDLCVEVGAEGGADVELTLENIAAGHRFPSGSSLDRRFWVELSAYDAEGELLWESGRVADDEAVTEREEALGSDRLWLMRDVAFDERGAPTHHFWEVASIEPRTLPGPQHLTPDDPGYEQTHVLRRFRFGTPRAVRALMLRVWARPMGREVLEELIERAELSPEALELLPTMELEGAARFFDVSEGVVRNSTTGRLMTCDR